MKTKIKNLLLLAMIGSSVTLSACVAPNTTTHLKINPTTGEVSWSNPKDTTIGSLTSSISTNGARSVTVTDFTTVNNPAVIKEAGAAQANSITATGTAATQIIDSLGTTAGKVGGAALKTAGP